MPDPPKTANNANINGRISANSGDIGGWTINEDSIHAGRTYLNSDGTIECEGLIATDADITGDIYANYLECDSGEIGGWVIDADGIKDRDEITILGSNGIISTDYVNIRYYGDSLGTLGWVRGDASG